MATRDATGGFPLRTTAGTDATARTDATGGFPLRETAAVAEAVADTSLIGTEGIADT